MCCIFSVADIDWEIDTIYTDISKNLFGEMANLLNK